MSKLSVQSILQISVLSLLFAAFTSCAVSANSETTASEKSNAPTVVSEQKPVEAVKSATTKGKIKIVEGSPSDVVRLFYKNLRERRFKEAMLMTNLRPAVEGLSDAEMQDLNSDFEPLAARVPAEIQINGEIITNNRATVTAKLPSNDSDSMELTEVELRSENGSWIVVTADKEAEMVAKKEGKNYFFTLRIDVHHVEVERMMQRISRAQSIFAAQSGGFFADFQTLITAKLLPDDVNDSKSTGYRFTMNVNSGNKKYYVNAVPEVYGKTGKLSFLLEADGVDQQARLKSGENKGQVIKK